ncbi:pyridoxamine 5'-phosphate oxidase family protein [Helicobacter sp. MIT 21-1697]|uniref:pyridoxamine 5'-phosphate oxidase family protein n=1 Tax=Helicobacter sp. MIT 21-1697 TaxID=2993733 RepID=UPI00224B8402|nr:pyridoxamine 5'-phosphate oxidase family protein [Helicobacter sp. MIT 21-1697]MCX2717482.1 pyridoxamine 5'-phosphate oxidase family protein [Helicobacter sp. MIT 21-1697]
MRRKDFDFKDTQIIGKFLNQIIFGTLVIPDSIPYAVPLSFCYEDSKIYLHGAKAGRKYELLKHNPKVAFSAAKPYSYIPSHFLHHTMIPTQFFFSVFVEGQFCVVEDLEEKKHILTRLVQKYEPNNQTMDMESGQFIGKEKGVFVGKIFVESLSAKAKFGQNLKQEDWEQIVQDLQNRNDRLDTLTIEQMKKFK